MSNEAQRTEQTPEPATSACLPKDTSSAERARILLALIDKQSAHEELTALAADAQSLGHGESAQTPGKMPSQETLLRSARELLSRLEPSQKTKTPPPVSREEPKRAPMTKSVIRSTIAALITESDIAKEHPAVIAIVLQKQDSKTKAAVLRQLPGPLARRIQACARLV